MAKPPPGRRIEACKNQILSEWEESNLFVDISDETALIAAAQLIETASFNLATRLPVKNTSELIEMSVRLSEVVAGLQNGLVQQMKQTRRPN